MINVLDALEIAGDAAGRQNPITTISDIRVLAALVQSARDGTFDITAMIKAKKLLPMIEAIAREADLLLAMMKDPNEAPKIEAIVAELATK